MGAPHVLGTNRNSGILRLDRTRTQPRAGNVYERVVFVEVAGKRQEINPNKKAKINQNQTGCYQERSI